MKRCARLGVESLVIACAMIGMALTPSKAFMFDAPKPLASTAATDSPSPQDQSDIFPSIAGDGNGNWIAFWCSADPTIGVVPGSLGRDAVFSRSSDDGKTWSPTATVGMYALTHDSDTATVATSTTGTWIAALHGESDEIVLARSVDNGGAWSIATPITSLATNVMYLRIAGDSQGRWVLAWQLYDDVNFWQLATSHSDDDGLTWSTPTRITYPGSAPAIGTFVRIATDDAGVWMLTWSEQPERIGVSVSTDGGATWGSPQVLWTFSYSHPLQPAIATDRAGTWMVVWETDAPANGADNDAFGDWDVVATVSQDDGEVWTEPRAVGGDAALEVSGQRFSPRVGYQHGVWQVLWTQALDSLGSTIGEEADLVGVRSYDSGASWSDPAAINLNAARDNIGGDFYSMAFPWRNIDFLPELATAANGTSMLVWSSTNSLNKTIGDDYDVFYARAHEDCPLVPREDCNTPTVAAASSILLNNPIGGRDKLAWKWGSGQSAPTASLGDPTTTSSYVLCTYDKAGGTLRSVLEADLFAASSCRNGSCWQTASGGYRYKDPDRRNGPVTKLLLKIGADGTSRLSLKASGASLAPPVMPFVMDPSVTFQLINLENQYCWQASFSQSQENSSTVFQAESD